jgi:hypothetical protein
MVSAERKLRPIKPFPWIKPDIETPLSERPVLVGEEEKPEMSQKNWESHRPSKRSHVTRQGQKC